MDDAEVGAYTQESRRRLQAATAHLVEALKQYTREVVAMHGGSKEMPSLFGLNESVARDVAEWNNAAADHTGTTPLFLGDVEEDDFEDHFGDEPDEQASEAAVLGQISVVSRWDLQLVDVERLLDVARAAHRRMRPEETEEDAAFAVADPGTALYAVAHEAGEPWFETPGIEVLGGGRVYVLPDEPLRRLDYPLDDIAASVEVPRGQVAFSEDWQ